MKIPKIPWWGWGLLVAALYFVWTRFKLDQALRNLRASGQTLSVAVPLPDYGPPAEIVDPNPSKPAGSINPGHAGTFTINKP